MALLYAAGGAFSLVGALFPLDRRTPVALDAALAATGLLGAALLAGLGRRLPPAALHAAFALFCGLLGVLAWRSATPQGVVGLGPALVVLGLYAAHFSPLPVARLQLAGAVVVATTGAACAAPGGTALPWTLAVTTAVAVTEAQGRLSVQLRQAADSDPLTGLANRRSWEAAAGRALARSRRLGAPVTVALLDLDDFKRVNDEQGHPAGDALLRDLAAGWLPQLRGDDVLGRYGGDEFVLCLPDTDEATARTVLGRLAASHPARWSTGTATTRGGEPLADLLARADAALYRDKRARRHAA
jgi:diguanylate cyclase (GGDEF)-like protein